jgi:hypothetical protein
MKLLYGEIKRAGRPKQGITFGQNYWPWQCKQRQRSHEGVRAVKVRVGWGRVPRSRQTKESESERSETHGGSVGQSARGLGKSAAQ